MQQRQHYLKNSISYLFVDLALQKYILLVVFTRPVRARLADILRHCSYSDTKRLTNRTNVSLPNAPWLGHATFRGATMNTLRCRSYRRSKRSSQYRKT